MTKGERLKMLREKANMTQEDLAKRLNTTKQTIHKYEKNIVTNIPSDRIEELAKVLDSTPEYILGWENTGDHVEQAIFEAKVLKDKELMDMVKLYMNLSETKKMAVRQMVETLSAD